MTSRVVVSQAARLELADAARWWAEHRSADEAQRWYDGFLQTLHRLATFPDSHPLADENDDFPYTIRELHYGLSSRPTHRAVYTIVDDSVIVLTIRHAAQDRIIPEDISERIDGE